MNGRQKRMDRRSFLGGTFSAIGLVGASTLFEQKVWAEALGFEPSSDNEFQGVLFTPRQMNILRVLTDLVLPETETPGGVEAGVHQFLDHQLSACYAEKDQQKTQLLLLKLDERSEALYQQTFLAISPDQQQDMLRNLENMDGFSEEEKDAFVFTKILMAFGYFTSEIGATQALSYQAIPGGFVGSIPYASVGKAWGAVDFY